MTSNDPDQLGLEKTQPTVAAHTLGDPTDPTQPATRGNTREDFNLDGSSQTALATHGSLTRYLARLAKMMFTQPRPYRATEEGDHLDPDTLGDPPDNIKATHGSSTRPMAPHGNIIRRLIKAFQGPTEAVEDLPCLAELKGYLAKVISGITKEITANSQEPDQTSNTSRTTFIRPTRSYQGVTKELLWRITFSPPPTILSPHYFHHQIFTTSLTIFTITPAFITPKGYNILPSFTFHNHHTITPHHKIISHLLLSLSPSAHQFISSLFVPNGYKTLAPSLSIFSSHHNQSRITSPPLISPTAPLIITPRFCL